MTSFETCWIIFSLILFIRVQISNIIFKKYAKVIKYIDDMHLFFNNTLIYDESVERNILALMNKKKS